MLDIHSTLKASLVTVATTLTASSVLAETVADRFVCNLGNEGRLVELTYLDQADSVPCEIRESKYSDQQRPQTRTLWRANFDLSFCQNQFENYRVKLQKLGWPCEVATADAVYSAREAKPSSVAFPSSVALPPSVAFTESIIDSGVETQEYKRNTNSANTKPVNATPANEKPANATPKRQVFIHESTIETFSFPHNPPVPPEFNEAGVSQRDLDQWIMYLSSQSMLAIRNLSPESESFSNYKLNEDLHTEDIYTRLQNRIEYLRSLLSER